jgi:hypothetical protein
MVFLPTSWIPWLMPEVSASTNFSNIFFRSWNFSWNQLACLELEPVVFRNLPWY